MLPDEIRLTTPSQRGESDTASIRSNIPGGNIRGFLRNFPPWDLVFSHMDHSDEEAHIRRISSSLGSVSSDDPELGLGRGVASSTVSADSGTQML